MGVFEIRSDSLFFVLWSCFERWVSRLVACGWFGLGFSLFEHELDFVGRLNGMLDSF